MNPLKEGASSLLAACKRDHKKMVAHFKHAKKTGLTIKTGEHRYELLLDTVICLAESVHEQQAYIENLEKELRKRKQE